MSDFFTDVLRLLLRLVLRLAELLLEPLNWLRWIRDLHSKSL